VAITCDNCVRGMPSIEGSHYRYKYNGEAYFGIALWLPQVAAREVHPSGMHVVCTAVPSARSNAESECNITIASRAESALLMHSTKAENSDLVAAFSSSRAEDTQLLFDK
jgi:hypothetical protein